MTRWAGVALSAAMALAMLSIGSAQRPSPATVTLTRHFTPEDQVTGRYQYVPFDVPHGTGRLRVDYDYDRGDGANVIDLGLFEPGPLDLGTGAFRGYSGGARSQVVIEVDTATPGYKPGLLPSGRWHVLLGLYKVDQRGVDVGLTIETGPLQAGSNRSITAARVTPPVDTGKFSWYTGALHTHTIHSDGILTPVELMRQFAEQKFDFVAITDHNNTTHALGSPALREQPPLWIIGEEVTTPGGHASVWGLPRGGWVDFRVLPGDPRIRDLVDAARKQGAIFSINHPASECLACGWTHEIVDGIEAIEISNGRHGEVEKAIAIWDKLLMSGRRITGVGSSDWHAPPGPIDNANVRVRATSLRQERILEAIRAGRVIVMTNAHDAPPEITVRAGGRSAAIGDTLELGGSGTLQVEVRSPAAAGGQLTVVSSERAIEVAFDAQGVARAEPRSVPGYVRFEMVKADGSPLAYTNPVYLVRP